MFIFLFLIILALHAEERDWVNDWPYRPLAGFEQVPSITTDDIDGYDFSITYALDGGRFGDQLTNYLRALWLSWKFDLPFYYRPFEHSDELCLSDFHPPLENRDFDAKLEYFYFLDLDITRTVFSYLDRKEKGKRKLLWNVGLLTPFIEERFCEKLDDVEFRKFIAPKVKPKNELNLVCIPEGRKSIALHVRTGVGYDWKVNIDNMPTKFPPDTFYAAGLKAVFNYYKNEPLFVFLFTDHPDPSYLRERILKYVTLPENTLFECRKENHHDRNVLEDLFSMAKFDALIHPDSSISRLSATLSAPQFEVKPNHWAEIRLNERGEAVYDNKGQFIVDPLIIERSWRGGPILKMTVQPVEIE